MNPILKFRKTDFHSKVNKVGAKLYMYLLAYLVFV